MTQLLRRRYAEFHGRRQARARRARSDLGFSDHNIILPDGRETLPGAPVKAATPLCRAALRTLGALLPLEAGTVFRVVDVGCLEGAYALAFAQAGYEVVGLEGRQSNFEQCEFVRESFDLPNLSFVRDDAWNLERYGPFDAVFCAGLVYHLDRPAQFLQLVGRVARRLAIVETHYAVSKPRLRNLALSRLETHDGRTGRWFEEWDPATDEHELDEALPWASVGNSRSFWLEKRHLLQALLDAGFPLVYEQHDAFGDDIVGNDYVERYCRSCFVGVRAD